MGNSMYHYWKSQPEVLRQILEQRKSQTEEFVKLFCAVNPDKLYLIGSGTSLNAERAAAGYMETMLDVDVCAVPSSRIPQLRGERPMVVFISQGGSSTNTLQAMEQLAAYPSISITGEAECEIRRRGRARGPKDGRIYSVGALFLHMRAGGRFGCRDDRAG